MTPRKVLLHALSPVVVLLVWETLARIGTLDVRFFPPPSAILLHLLDATAHPELWNDLRRSLGRVVVGYGTGAVLGIACGTAMGLSPLVRAALYPLVAVTYPIPKIALLPLILLIFGIGELSKIVIVAIGAFFLVLLSTLHGVTSIARIYHDVARVYRIRAASFVARIVLPGALPSIFTGLKLAIGYSLVVMVAAEFTGADAGVGYRIWQSWETFSIKSMYASLFIIALLGISCTYALELLERVLVPWARRN
jgi:NitT/TauT family transport system permease protein